MSACQTSKSFRRHSASFLFNDTATTLIYTLSLHDALPIFAGHRTADEAELIAGARDVAAVAGQGEGVARRIVDRRDRKSTRLNSSHTVTSYAVFCLKKKNRVPTVSDARNITDVAQGVPCVH